VNKESVLANGIVAAKDADKIVPYIDIHFKGNALYKNRIMMLDIIANNNWERPIYFTGGSYGDDDFLWMKDYLELDGLGYKLVPILTPQDQYNPYDLGRVDGDKLYDKVMAWEWGNSGSPDIYHDPETRKNGITYRSNIARLVETLIQERKFDKAEKILDLGMKKMPIDKFGYYTLIEPFIAGYYNIDKKEKGRKYYLQMAVKYKEKLDYYKTLDLYTQKIYGEDIIADLERYKALIEILAEHRDEIAGDEIETIENYTYDFAILLNDFNYAIGMEVFIEYLYLSGNTDKAHEIFYNSIEEYQDRLTRISEISPEQQAEYQNGILNDLEEYRMLVALPLIYKDSILFKKESSVFNDYVNKFRHLMVADAAEDSVPVAE
jgi:tetratricopeptide (TPR) repeat protein